MHEEAERYLFLAWGELPLEFDFGGGAADGAAEAGPAALDAPDPEELPPADLDDDLGALLPPLLAAASDEGECVPPADVASPWKTPRPPPQPHRLCWLENRPTSSSPSRSAPLSTRQRLYIEELVAEQAGADATATRVLHKLKFARDLHADKLDVATAATRVTMAQAAYNLDAQDKGQRAVWVAERRELLWRRHLERMATEKRTLELEVRGDCHDVQAGGGLHPLRGAGGCSPVRGGGGDSQE